MLTDRTVEGTGRFALDIVQVGAVVHTVAIVHAESEQNTWVPARRDGVSDDNQSKGVWGLHLRVCGMVERCQ